MANQKEGEALKKTIENIVKKEQSITYKIEAQNKKICFFFDFKGDRARQSARLCAANWWNRINEELEQTFYFEVACTWLDAYNELFLEVVTSHNFPNKKKVLNPTNNTPTPTDGEQRQ